MWVLSNQDTTMKGHSLALFVCAGLLLSGGAILGGSTAWSLLRMSYYFWTSDLGMEIGSATMLLAGALLCLPTCWLATVVPYYPRSVSVQATLMCVLTAAMLVLSMGLLAMSGLSHALRDPEALNHSMTLAMAREATEPSVRNAFAAMQLELKCCGVLYYTDWLKHRSSLPSACCNRHWSARQTPLSVKRVQCEVPVYTGGCLHPAMMELRSFVNTVSALTAVIIVIMAMTLFAAAYSLVCGALSRSESKLSAPMRVACLHPLSPQAPPLSALNSLAALHGHTAPQVM